MPLPLFNRTAVPPQRKLKPYLQAARKLRKLSSESTGDRDDMKKIGVLFGVENSFPGALVEHINARNLEDVKSEFVHTGAVLLDQPPHYAVIVDRISHTIPFYRSYLKQAAFNGTAVLNNPFWCSADDKLFNYTLAKKLGIAVPATAMLPHKQLPADAIDRTMRNLEFPLDWERVFSYVGENGYLKPVGGGGGREVFRVHNREEFFRAYDQSRDLCMVYQKAIDYTSYFRCYVVGQKKVRVMPYDPQSPHEKRYVQDAPPPPKRLLQRMEKDALKLCQALGYDLNTVEFAVKKGIPYAIDFMNPVPDADPSSVGQANFDWFVNEVADLAIAKALATPFVPELRWSAFLTGELPKQKAVKPARTVKKASKNSLSKRK